MQGVLPDFVAAVVSIKFYRKHLCSVTYALSVASRELQDWAEQPQQRLCHP